jgi:membrane-bound lytic murein transglycosylase D
MEAGAAEAGAPGPVPAPAAPGKVAAAQPPGAGDLATPPVPLSDKAAAPPPPKEPVSARQTDSAALLPAGPPTGSSDATDYSVAADDTVVVQAAETLGHFADWSGVDSQALRALNKLHKNAMVTLGRRIKLDLSRVTAEQFAAARRNYHHQLQEAFFAAHRIAGTENYSVKRGDSLWTIAQHSGVPIWLVAQYNPDVDFNDMRPGTAVTVPRVEDINRQ